MRWWPLLLACLPWASTAQVVSLSAGGGFTLAHADYVAHLAQSHSTRVMAEYCPARWGALADMSLYKKPQFGLMGGWVNFRQANLGQAFPVMFCFSNAIGPGKNRVGAYYRAGAGLAYITNTFSGDNYRNTAIGFPVTFSIQASAFLQIVLSKELANWQTALRLEAGLLHFSDGAVQLPNAGLNQPYGQLGIMQRFSPTSSLNKAETVGDDYLAAPKLARRFCYITGGIGPKQAVSARLPERLAYNGTIEYGHRFGERSAVSAGADMFYSRALDDDRAALGLTGGSRLRAGVNAGHDWLLAGVGVTTQIGAYLYNGLPQAVKPVYQRYGVRFLYGRRISPAIFLRSHLAKADGVEFSIACRLFQSKQKDVE